MLGLLVPTSPRVRATASLELYGTIHAMGVIVTVADTDDPDRDAVASVTYRTGSDPYRAGFPLTRVADTRFVGSLFWLAPDTVYDVRILFSDPDAGPLDGVVVEGSASTRAEISIPTPSQSFFVSPGGSGTACSLATPCSLSEGLTGAGPGDEVVLRGGVYYQGDISLPRSGLAGAPIVVRSHTGEAAILDGADPASPTFAWTHDGNGVYRTTVNVADTHFVMANGARLFPYDDLSDLQNLSRDNTPGFYTDGTTLYVHLAGDADPNGATMMVARYNNAFYVERDFVYFVDLTFRHYGQGSYAKAIYFNNGSDNLVQGCIFANNDLGIGIKRASHRNVIQDNEFYDTIFQWPWAEIKDVGRLEDGGVAFYDPATGRGNIIRRNDFHDDFDGFGVCPSGTAAVTNETDIYGNRAYNLGDDGVETDGQCSNVRIWGNTFHDVLVGISVAPVYDGPVYAIRNLIYRTGVGNNDYSGTPFKFNSGFGKSGPMYLFHNTADAALPGNDGLDIKSPGSWDVVYARNNIWAGTAYALSNANPTQPLDLDYDDLYTTQAGELAWWSGLPDRHLNTLAELQAETGQEPNGFNLEPGFSDPASGDYTLGAASDLIDVGVVIPGVNDDFNGVAPDVGAFEYAGEGFILSVAPSARTIFPGGVATYTVGVQPVGTAVLTVTLSAASPAPSLTLKLMPGSVVPPDQAILTVTDTHPVVGSALMPGLWYTIPVTGTGNGSSHVLFVDLLVGGVRNYLPLTLRE
jgi:parallel beta-helix repeat protein